MGSVTESTPIPPVVDPDQLRRYLKRHAKVWGAAVRTRRKALGMPLHEVAERAGTTTQTVFKVEKGEILARDHLRIAIAFALATNVDDLFPLPALAQIAQDLKADAA